MLKATRAYRDAHGNATRLTDTEAGSRALLPYFATPQEAADFVEYLEAMKQAGLLPP